MFLLVMDEHDRPVTDALCTQIVIFCLMCFYTLEIPMQLYTRNSYAVMTT